MIVMWIDQSFSGTGVCILNDSKMILSELIVPSTKSVHRLVEIKNKLIKIYNDNKPDFVYMEKYMFTPKRAMAFELGELAGAIKTAFVEVGVTPVVVYTTHLKKYITGSGNAEKSLMLLKIFQKFGIEFNNNNLADAFLIAKIGEQAEILKLVKSKEKRKKGLEKYEWEVIKEYIK